MKAEDIMKKKVITVKEHDTVQEVANVLLENGIGGVPVVSDDNRVLGIITEGDLIYQGKKFQIPAFVEILGGVFYFNNPTKFEKDLKKMVAIKAADIMSTKIISVQEDTPLDDIATLMVEKEINRVPVVSSHRKLVGIISRQDIIKAIHQKQE
ncbi:CBS domain-containing protein [Candidatus Contubernalis alkaliaceticus]|uniref:CBS domain-containing protein n=1 Tax=Candidatus Contubernalis alkaliaceticus TaxID=338645 RepID=UPI001F4C3142|nr:CBS domain-containing protein [Candidatus Contubernalis alkalaceticus]UNC91429.1 CBS domain-containing protein [Candidatus Contubernalis alkalaceticus]